MKVTQGLNAVVLAAAVMLMTACGRAPNLVTGENSMASSSGRQLGFDDLSAKIFQPKCLACHAQLATYEGLMNSGMISGKSPEASSLYIRVANGDMPKNMGSLSESDVKALYDWISAGSPQFSTVATGETGGAAGAPTGPVAGGPVAPTGPVAISATYAWIQAQVFVPRCIICHRGASAAGGYDLSTYEGTLAGGRVLAGNSASSRLFGRINDNSMPPGGPALSAEVKAAIAQWIQNGAMNDAPADGQVGPPPAPVVLPPLEPKFSSLMANVFGPRCVACHNSVTARAGVNLSSYAAVVRNLRPGNANDSDIYKEVEDNDMPASGGPLTFEQKETLRQWINAGALNN